MPARLLNPVAIYQGLPNDIYFIALARFVLGLGNFIIPFMVLLLTQKLGYSTTVAGGLAMGVTACYLLGNLVGGKMSDSFGHKNMMVWGEIVGAIILVVSGFFADWHTLLPALLFVSYFFFGVALPASNALVADLSTPANRNAVMSLSYLAYNLGSGVGPVLAGYLFWNYTAWIFWGNGLAGLIGVAIVLFYVATPAADRATDHSGHSELEKATDASVWQVFKQRPRLLVFGVLCMLLWFSLNQMTMTTPLYLSHIFGQQGPTLYGQLMTSASILVVVLTPLIIRMTLNICDIQSLAISALALAMGYGITLLSPLVAMQFIAWFFLTIGEILLVTKEGIYLANHSPRSHRGRISGIVTTIRSLGLMPTYILMGAYIQSYGYLDAWKLIIGISVLTGMLFIALSLQQSKASKTLGSLR
ncbi:MULTISPECIES: MFS transporter [unclassified Serratia (in: enterobacteria)]|uniref:MFS transporter n=1 Tax=unclassified Serratia (in: enterobacteria) TaxID=2647522 RepID=UPI0004A8136C|nr:MULTISPECIES: MFS transporter [unclassified Serratia (in: enterobacteria)]